MFVVQEIDLRLQSFIRVAAGWTLQFYYGLLGLTEPLGQIIQQAGARSPATCPLTLALRHFLGHPGLVSRETVLRVPPVAFVVAFTFAPAFISDLAVQDHTEPNTRVQCSKYHG